MSRPDPMPLLNAGNGVLVRRLFGLAWRYRLHSLQVLGIQLILLTLGIGGLSFTGVGIDYIRHQLDHTPVVGSLPKLLPSDWPPMHVLALLAGLILLFALLRADRRRVFAEPVDSPKRRKYN